MSGSGDKLIYNNKNGIHSLAGFSFQIKVFAYYALCISRFEEFVEFETLDDINIKITPINIDNKIKSYTCNAKYSDVNNLIQVKRTSLSKEDFNKTLYNWILQSAKFKTITKYILFSDSDYNNQDLMFSIPASELYNNAINTSKKRSDAIEVQIKNLYGSKFSEFEQSYNYVQERYIFIGNANIDELIYEKAKMPLRFNEKDKAMYKERLEYFINTIQNNILFSINKKEPYILSANELINIYEDINTSLNKNNYWPPYYSFKEKLDHISLQDSEIANWRETKQLRKCKLSERNTLERLKELLYYKHFRDLSIENGKISSPNNIETTTYNNFQSVIEELLDTEEDKPKKRLIETEKRNNNHAPTDELRCGSCIYLTGENTTNQISWEDSRNANN